jgi:GNAT superfamily N-acetyltransferase
MIRFFAVLHLVAILKSRHDWDDRVRHFAIQSQHVAAPPATATRSSFSLSCATTSTEGGTMPNPTQRYRFEWRAEFSNEALNELHAEAFNHAVRDHDWLVQVSTHSLGWVCAFEGDTLVGFINVPWDGAQHAFIIDPVVLKRYERQGVGTALVALASERARAAGCKWLHVDFDEPLRRFYFDACGFTPTIAGLIDLSAQAPIAGPTADGASR